MSRKINDGLTKNQRFYRRHSVTPEQRAANATRIRLWRQANPEKDAASCHRYYVSHAEELKAKGRQQQRARRARLRGTPEQRENYRHAAEQRRARLACVERTLTRAEWQEICERFRYRCAYCGEAGRLEQDHVVPLSKGGPHTKENIVPACKRCNSSKGNRR